MESIKLAVTSEQQIDNWQDDNTIINNFKNIMERYSNLNSVMETRDHSKNGASLKSRMGRVREIIIMNIMKQVFFFLIVFSFIILQSCEKENKIENENQYKLYALEISNETEWDYLIAGEDKSFLFMTLNKNTSIPQYLTFSYNGITNNAFTVIFKDNGLPDIAYIDEYILVFDNFRNNLFNLAIIKSDNTISYFFDIESNDINWQEIIESGGKTTNFRSSGGLIELQHSLKFLANSLSAVSCVMSTSAAIATGGIAIPLAVVSCGTFINGAINSYAFNSSNFGIGLSATNTVVSHVGNLVECAVSGASCVVGLAADFISVYSTTLEAVNLHKDKIDEAIGEISRGQAGTIHGEWSCYFSEVGGYLPIILRENGTANLGSFYNGTWNVTGSNITIGVTYHDSELTSNVTLNGIINESKNQINGNYSVNETYYTENGTFVMNKIQGQANAIGFKLSTNFNNNKSNVLFPVITK